MEGSISTSSAQSLQLIARNLASGRRLLRLAPAAVASREVGHAPRPPRAAAVLLDAGRLIEERLHDPPGLLDDVPAGEERRSPCNASVRRRSYGPGGCRAPRERRRRARPPACPPCRASWRRARSSSPHRVRSGRRFVESGARETMRAVASSGTCCKRTTISVAVTGMLFPARTKIGTPAQRQFSIVSRRPTNVSVSERAGRLRSCRTPVLAPHGVRRVHGGHCAKHVQSVTRDRVVVAGRGLHGHEREHLQEVVLDHVPQCPDAVEERPTPFDPEVFRHRDLDRVDVLSAPHRLEQGVREPQVHDVLHRLLAEEVIDAVQALLGYERREASVQLAGGDEIRPERLLDHEPRVVQEPRGARCSELSRKLTGGIAR